MTKIYIAGHRSMVGSAISFQLQPLLRILAGLGSSLRHVRKPLNARERRFHRESAFVAMH